MTTNKFEERRQSKDRRIKHIGFERRSHDRRNRFFYIEKVVYLSDTNAFGNTYFAKYFEWQGMAREAFLAKHLVPDVSVLMKAGIKLITAEAHHKYNHETVVFDRVRIEVRVTSLKRITAEIQFIFTNATTGVLIGKGRQVLAFAGPNGKLIRVPDIIRENAKRFMTGG